MLDWDWRDDVNDLSPLIRQLSAGVDGLDVSDCVDVLSCVFTVFNI